MERRDKTNPMIDGDEFDILTPYRKNRKIEAGVAREVKRKYNKRTRRKVEQDIQRELDAFVDSID